MNFYITMGSGIWYALTRLIVDRQQATFEACACLPFLRGFHKHAPALKTPQPEPPYQDQQLGKAVEQKEKI
jgi:hypothetical protein